jgi:hypothetical protein
MTTDQPPGSAPLPELRWRKSSYSGTAGNCLEVAQPQPGIRAIRNSHHPTGPILTCTTDHWTALTTQTSAGWINRAQNNPPSRRGKLRSH